MSAAPVWDPEKSARLDALDTGDERPPTSWQPVDLTDALEGRDLPEPELLQLANDRFILYRRRVHWFQGESESCKSWLALLAAAQVLDAGGHVLWIDYEDDDRGVVARLLALGVDPQAIRARFIYIRPDEPLKTRNGWTEAATDLIEVLQELGGEVLDRGDTDRIDADLFRRFDLTVIDGITEALTTEGMSYLDNADIAAWLRMLPKYIAAKTDAAVVCIDHLPKDRENQGRYAIGGQHKLAGTTGAAYRLDVRKRFRRSENGDPVDGEVAITVVKDRPGWVRAHAPDDRVGTMTLTAWPDGGVSIAVTQPSGTDGPPLELCRRILEHLATYPGLSARAVEQAVTGNTHAIRGALKWMADQPRGWVRVDPHGRSHLHHLTDTGREEFGL